MPRKPHNDKPMANAWDDALTDAQRWQAYDKFVQFRSKWWEVAAWVEAEYGIKAPSRSGLYRFADRMKPLEAAYRVRQSIEARAFAGELAKKAGQTDEDLVAAYETLAADAALQLGDAAKAAMYTRMAIAIGEKIATRRALEIKARAQDTKEEALKLQREKFEAAESRLKAAREAVARLNEAGGLSEEARAEIEKAMGVL